MFFFQLAFRKQLAEFRSLLDHEEGRLLALARVAGDVKRDEIAAKVRSVRATRDRLQQTFDDAR